jgi:branched-chain amino acid transport system ATP-binding protein
MSLLETIHLKKYFGETRAVDDVSLVVKEGEFMSLVGPNGAGKTTLINVVSGFFPPDSGELRFQGRDITRISATGRVAAGIARSFQVVNLFDERTVFDNVAQPIFAREGKMRRMFSLADHDDTVIEEAMTVLDQFGMAEKADILAGDLAQGERKLLDVAVAYALKPALLCLDEPTSGVSTRDKGQIMDTIAAVVRGGGITAVIVEHDMDVVFKYSDRIVAMHQGRILADGTPDEIRRNSEVATVLLGTPMPGTDAA